MSDTTAKNPEEQALIFKMIVPLVIGVIAAILIISVGISLSIYLQNWNWFSRFGSLVVVSGLFLAKWDFENLIMESDLTFVDKIIYENAKIIIPNKTLDDDSFIEVKNRVKKLMSNHIKPAYTKAEIFIITVGTIIWGFGDLLQSIFT